MALWARDVETAPQLSKELNYLLGGTHLAWLHGLPPNGMTPTWHDGHGRDFITQSSSLWTFLLVWCYPDKKPGAPSPAAPHSPCSNFHSNSQQCPRLPFPGPIPQKRALPIHSFTSPFLTLETPVVLSTGSCLFCFLALVSLKRKHHPI